MNRCQSSALSKAIIVSLGFFIVACGGGGGGGDSPQGSGGPPVVATLAPTTITATSAILNGNVTPDGLSTTAWFEWGTSSTLATYTTTSVQSIGSGTASVLVTNAMSGLLTGSNYYFRVCANNSSGTSKGSIVSFTPGAPPTVTTLSASAVTATSERLNGTVTANGLSTTVWFEWGTSPTLATYTTTSVNSVGSGATNASVEDVISGLSAGTTYYFRVGASNSSGTSKGVISSFVAGLAPIVTTLAPTSILTNSATLNGSVIPNNFATTAWFEWGTNSSFTTYSSTTAQSVGSGMTNQLVNASITGLIAGTTYFYRLAASNSIGMSRGATVVFSILPAGTVRMGGSIQGTPLSLTGATTTLAGTLSGGSQDGTGTGAGFKTPLGVTTDGTNLYVADRYNYTIRRIVIATAEVTTLAGSAGSWGTADGTGASARFLGPDGITTDGTSLFVVEPNGQTIRKVVIATGEVTTFAGTPGLSGSADGVGSGARFSSPQGITTDGTNLFVTDTANNTIRKIVIATREVTTLAGSATYIGASVDGIGAAARFNYPDGITTDGTNLFVADTHNSTIRKVVIVTGEVTTILGSAGIAGSSDGVGTAARFNQPSGITMDGTNLFVADTVNNTIRKVVIATQEVTTLAGSAGSQGSADGSGATARFTNPIGVTTNGVDLFIADMGNNTIRRIQ